MEIKIVKNNHMELDKNTQLCLLQKFALGDINSILNENFLLGEIWFVDKYVRDPNNKWKQERVDKAIKVLDEFKQKYEIIKNSDIQ